MFELFSKHENEFPFEPSMSGGAAGGSGTCSFPKFEAEEPTDMVQSCSEKLPWEWRNMVVIQGRVRQSRCHRWYATLKLNCARKHAEKLVRRSYQRK